MLKFFKQIIKDFFNQEPVVKGGIMTISQNPPPNPVGGKWGTKVPKNNS